MSRTVELGRAVLSTTRSPHQLWFTTLITISPQDEATKFQQLKEKELLEHLANGKFWVCRGRGLHLALDILVEGEALEHEDKKKLADSLMNAPVWSQLSLRPSLQVERVAEDQPPRSRILVNIDHVRENDDDLANPLHRLGPKVPFADIIAPEGISAIALQSVTVSMDLFRVTPRATINRRKRSTQSSPLELAGANGRGNEESSENVGTNDEAESEMPKTSVFEVESMQHPTNVAHEAPSGHDEIGRGPESTSRSRQADCIPKLVVAVPTVATRKRKRDASPLIDMDEMEALIDTAMRVSVCTTTPKLAQGIKLVTKIFKRSLSELCPALWTPEYLRGFAHRAHFLPTVSRAFGRVAGRGPRSLSLQRKMRELANNSADGDLDGSSSPDPVPQRNHSQITQSLHTRLWSFSQKNIAEKSTRPLWAFRSSSQQASRVNCLEEAVLNMEARPNNGLGYLKFRRPAESVDLEPTSADSSRVIACKSSAEQRTKLVSNQIVRDERFENSNQEVDSDDLLLDSALQNFVHDDLDDRRRPNAAAASQIEGGKGTLHTHLEDTWIKTVPRESIDLSGSYTEHLESSRTLQVDPQHTDLIQVGAQHRESDDPDEMLLWANSLSETTESDRFLDIHGNYLSG